MTYTQLTQEQRYQIYALLKIEPSQTKIAAVLGVHKSTISRELQRNRGQRGYRPQQAHRFAQQRRRKVSPKSHTNRYVDKDRRKASARLEPRTNLMAG